MSDASPVTIFRTWELVPVFHLLRPWDDGGHEVSRIPLDDGRTRVEHRSRALCGREVDAWGWMVDERVEGRFSPVSDEHSYYRLRLRRDHAERFARLCRRCEAADAADHRP